MRARLVSSHWPVPSAFASATAPASPMPLSVVFITTTHPHGAQSLSSAVSTIHAQRHAPPPANGSEAAHRQGPETHCRDKGSSARNDRSPVSLRAPLRLLHRCRCLHPPHHARATCQERRLSMQFHSLEHTRGAVGQHPMSTKLASTRLTEKIKARQVALVALQGLRKRPRACLIDVVACRTTAAHTARTTVSRTRAPRWDESTFVAYLIGPDRWCDTLARACTGDAPPSRLE